MSKARLKVAINAQVSPGGASGGIEQAVLGLIWALGRAEDDGTEYIIVTRPEAPDWVQAFLGQGQRVVVRSYPAESRAEAVTGLVKRALRPARPVLRPIWRSLRDGYRRALGNTSVPVDDFFESLGVDVVHFPYQSMVLSSLPSIFSPWDLQHLHYPEFFSPSDLAKREMMYPAWCRNASAIVTASQFTKRDIVRHYDIAPEKIHVIPFAASTAVSDPVSPQDLASARQTYRLPATFAFYPAQTWPHKNHIRLIEALALLRDRHGLRVQLVCSGVLNKFWPIIARRIDELEISDQMCFLGFVPTRDLRALYRLAQFVVIPSLFEGWGFPLVEAFCEGTPVASSNSTSLVEYAGDAALLFDGASVESIGDAVRRMATDAELRNMLRKRGCEQARLFSWDRTARAHRALYRKVGGRTLSEQERRLLGEGSSEGSCDGDLVKV